VPVEKRDPGLDEISDVLISLAGGVAAVMQNPHGGIEYQPPLPTQPQRQVKVLKIQEEILVEAPGFAYSSGSHQHKTAAGEHDFRLLVALAPVPHFIVMQASAKKATDKTGGKSPQQ
jgi:hypothetical protein